MQRSKVGALFDHLVGALRNEVASFGLTGTPLEASTGAPATVTALIMAGAFTPGVWP